MKMFTIWKSDERRSSLQEATDLDTPLFSELHLSLESRQRFLELAWKVQPPSPPKADNLARFEFYFHHYHECCWKISSVIKTCSHRHVCQTIRELKDRTREQCEEAVLQSLPAGSTAAMAAELVDFTGKAALFIDFADWESTESLPIFLSRKIASKSTIKDEFRMRRSFNARAFAMVAGINVQWTRNLAEHLEVTGDDSDIAIFHCVAALDLYEQSEFNQMLPAGFVEETRRTLALMLPSADQNTQAWLEKQKRKRKLDPRCGSCPHVKASQRHTRDFDFWRDRIVVAKEVFDEHQPKGILQVWRDNRNQVQWWTFWIAIILFILTIIACVEGALQVYKAYRPSS
ncbi:hypothetical protein CLAIMM_10701 [Cladophialophora immunda]|nr:hypothetical protein CLAIMM_10701 [Cladophialophora immunda]